MRKDSMWSMTRASICGLLAALLVLPGWTRPAATTSGGNTAAAVPAASTNPALMNALLAGQIAGWTEEKACPTPPPLHLPAGCCGSHAGVCGNDPISLDGSIPVAVDPCGPISSAPVNMATGQVHEETADISLPAPGLPIEVRRHYDPTSKNLWWGERPMLPAFLVFANAGSRAPGTIRLYRVPEGHWDYTVTETPDGQGGYDYAMTPDDTRNNAMMTYDETNQKIVVGWPTGEVATFDPWSIAGDGSQGNPYTAFGGALVSYRLTSGGFGVEFGYSGTEVLGNNKSLDYIKYGTSSTTYRYVDVSENTWNYPTDPSLRRIEYVKVYAGSDTTGELLAQVEYDHFGENTTQSQNGSNGAEILKATVSRRMTGDSGSSLSESRTTMYRYYTSTSGVGGGVKAVKMILRPEAYARLEADVSTKGWTSVYNAPDGDRTNSSSDGVVWYASHAFEYDDGPANSGIARVVELELVRSACGSCGGAGGLDGQLVTYAYFNSSTGRTLWPSGSGTQAAVWEGVVTLSDGTTNEHYFVNDDGKLIKKVIDPGADAQDVWATSWKIDAYGRTEEVSRPDGTVLKVEYATETNGTQYTGEKVLGKPSAVKLTKPTYTDRKVIAFTYTSDTYHARVATRTLYADNGTTGEETAASYSGVSGGTQRSVSLPVVSYTKNGNASTDAELAWFNGDRRLVWTKSPAGRVDFYQYDVGSGTTNTGLLRFHIADINTGASQPSGVSLGTIPTGYSTSSGANLVTEYVRDNLGRAIKRIDPDGLATYTVYKDGETRTHTGFDQVSGQSGLGTSILPTSVVKMNRDGLVTESFEVKADKQFNRNSTTGYPTGLSDSITDSDKVAKRTRTYNNAGMLTEERAYFDIADGTNGYAKTEYGYDSRGRLNRLVDPMGTIRRTVYEPFGRASEEWVGTDDTPTSGTWSPSNITGTDLEKIRSYTYGASPASTGGTSLYLVKVTSPIDDSNDRAASYTYDEWGRRVGMFAGDAGTGGEGTADTWEYDNLDRMTVHYNKEGFTGSLNSPTAGTTFNIEKTYYDQRGRVWKEELAHTGRELGTIGGSNAGGGVGSDDNIIAYIWYGANGRPVKRQITGQAALKWSYDTMSRLSKRSVSDAGGDVAGGSSTDSLTSASSITGDAILEQTEYTYDSGSRVTVSTHFSRDHDQTGTGSDLTASAARPQYTHFYYDAAGRQTHTAEYGTNGSSESAPSYASSPPSSSDTILVSRTEYHTQSGRAYRITNPKGQITHYDFDDAGRILFVAENYVNWVKGTLSTIGGPSGETDQDRVTACAYTKNGDVKTITAYLTTSNSETTKYVYGITKGAGGDDSRLTSNSMLKAVIYPDSDDVDSPLGDGSDTTYDRMELQYDRQGGVRWMKDPRGVVRYFEYDKIGRLTRDRMTSAPPSPVDGAVREITRSYNALGWIDRISSKDSSATVLNQVQFTYNGFGQVRKSGQAIDGATTSNTATLQHTYASGSTYASRLSSMTYPQGFVLTYDYGTGVNDAISRVAALKEGSNNIVKYTYLGMRTPVGVTYPTTDAAHPIVLDSTKGSDSTSSTYESWDQFNRITLQNWIHYQAHATTSADVDVIKISHTYDRNSNRLTRDEQIALPTDNAVKRDELYTYDGLNRLNQLQQGTLTSGSIEGTNPPKQEKWTLDALGNWDTYQYDGTGDGDFVDGDDLNDDRSHNVANELTQWDPFPGNSSSSAVSPVMDRAGNITDDAWNYKFTYDAWNRLVQVQNQSSTVVGRYTYDGLGRRIKRIVDTDGDGTAETNDDDKVQREYYTNAWQRIEVRPRGTTSTDTTNGVSLYVYGLRYVDDVAQRRRDTNIPGALDGSPDEYIFYLTDANYNVVMLVTDGARGLERIFYSAYGMPECFPFGDADGDYDVDSNDANAGGGYNILKDINLDGLANQTDINIGSGYAGLLGGLGELTSATSGGAGPGNEVGYAGYLWADERSHWHVRHRELSPRMGRWLQKDPVKYHGSTLNLYEIVRGTPIGKRDPSGLEDGDDDTGWFWKFFDIIPTLPESPEDESDEIPEVPEEIERIRDIDKMIDPVEEVIPTPEDVEETIKYLQLALEIGGCAPIIGEVCDGANCFIYICIGDPANAIASVCFMIPFTDLAKGGRFAVRACETYQEWQRRVGPSLAPMREFFEDYVPKHGQPAKKFLDPEDVEQLIKFCREHRIPFKIDPKHETKYWRVPHFQSKHLFPQFHGIPVPDGTPTIKWPGLDPTIPLPPPIP